MTATSKPGSPRTRSSHWSPSTGTPLRSEPACGTITQTASAAPGLAAPPGDQYRSRRALHNSWAYLRAPAHPDHSSANYRTTSHTGPSSIRVATFRRSKNPNYWLVTFEPSSDRCAERVKGAGSLVGQGFRPPSPNTPCTLARGQRSSPLHASSAHTAVSALTPCSS